MPRTGTIRSARTSSYRFANRPLSAPGAFLALSFSVLCVACAGGNGGKPSGPPASEPAQSDADGTAPQRPAGPDGHAIVRLLAPGQDPVEVESEVVYTPAGRQRGLMYRRDLGQDAGMLFLFPSEQPLSFWMRNTYLPLDMIFIRADLTVLGVVENAEPLTETSRRVPGVSQYVLEVNAGYCRQHGIAEGTRVEFEGTDDEQPQVR